MKCNRVGFVLPFVVATLSITGSLQAQTWDEQSDAGALPETAQIPDGRDELIRINGNYSSGADADMYLIHIDDPNAFRASTVNLSQVDTQLFLFDENGFGITHNDDDPSGIGGLRSVITGTYVPAAGHYYLATSQYDLDPTSNGQQIWNDTPFGAERPPDGPGASGRVNGWDGSGFGSGSYGIALSGVSYPNPGPGLSIGGSCPGVVNAVINRLSPGGRVALVATMGGGQRVIPPGMPCAGVELELSPSAQPIITVGRANGDGEATLSGQIPAAVCGLMYAQAIDLEQCITSNVTQF